MVYKYLKIILILFLIRFVRGKYDRILINVWIGVFGIYFYCYWYEIICNIKVYDNENNIYFYLVWIYFVVWWWCIND